MQRPHFVPLTSGTGANEVTDGAAIVVEGEVGAETLERFLDALVASCVGELQDVGEDSRGAGDKDTAFVDDEAVADALGVTVVTCSNNVMPGAQRVVAG